jgi:hypothetical protein
VAECLQKAVTSVGYTQVCGVAAAVTDTGYSQLGYWFQSLDGDTCCGSLHSIEQQ